jgi:hypothetical protein
MGERIETVRGFELIEKVERAASMDQNVRYVA